MQFKRKIYYFLLVVFMPIVKEPPCSAGDLGLIPGLGNSPGKNTGMGSHSLLQKIFPTQGPIPHLLCLLHWQKDSLPLNHLAMLIPNSVLLLTQHTSRPLLCSINWCILKNANSFQHQPEQNKRRAHQPWDNKSADELVGVFLLLFFKKKSATDMYNTQSVKSTCWKSMGPIFSLIN